MDAMTKMWVSFIAIGLMVFASVLITYARYKTKGIVKIILSIIAFVLLFFSVIYGLLSII